MPQLTHIKTLKATLVIETGLRIGGGDTGMHIGGVDSPVIKHPHTHEPYIPGSSIKGKVRSLLEWASGAVQPNALGFQDYQNTTGKQQATIKHILQLFGMGGSDKLTDEQAMIFGPTRVAFWDCHFCPVWKENIINDNLPLTEVKSENRIDRIKGTAEHPRQIERIPAGAEFEFRLSIKELTGDDGLFDTMMAGLKLLELDSLGGSGSRGYGKIRFQNISIDDQPFESFDAIKPFEHFK